MNRDRRLVLASLGVSAASLTLYRIAGADGVAVDDQIVRRVQARYTADLIVERRQADDRETRIIEDCNRRISAHARKEKSLKVQIAQLEAQNARLAAQAANQSIAQLKQQVVEVASTKDQAYAQLRSVVDEVAQRTMPGQVANDLAFIRNVVSGATPQQVEDLSTYADDNFYIFYAFQEYVLTPEAQEVVQRAAAHVRDVQRLLSAATVVVIGHAEPGGVNDDNGTDFLMRLAEREAKSVADALVTAGVPIPSLTLDWNTTPGQARQEDGYEHPFYTHISIMRGAAGAPAA